LIDAVRDQINIFSFIRHGTLVRSQCKPAKRLALLSVLASIVLSVLDLLKVGTFCCRSEHGDADILVRQIEVIGIGMLQARLVAVPASHWKNR
jgi:hypothetical protein